MSPRDEFFESFRDLLSKEFHARGFAFLGGPSDRHGAWELSFGRTGVINLYVIIAGIPRRRQTNTGPEVITFEIVVGADHEDRFTRRIVDRGFDFTENQLQFVSGSFLRAVSEAMNIAERLTIDDLTDRYLPPHSPTRSTRQ